MSHAELSRHGSRLQHCAILMHCSIHSNTWLLHCLIASAVKRQSAFCCQWSCKETVAHTRKHGSDSRAQSVLLLICLLTFLMLAARTGASRNKADIKCGAQHIRKELYSRVVSGTNRIYNPVAILNTHGKPAVGSKSVYCLYSSRRDLPQCNSISRAVLKRICEALKWAMLWRIACAVSCSPALRLTYHFSISGGQLQLAPQSPLL